MQGDKRRTKPGMPGPPPSSQELETEHRRDRMETLPELEAPPTDASSLEAPPSSLSSPPPAVDPVESRDDSSASSAPSHPPTSYRHALQQTVPGGGLNRVSDGRQAAAAYIGIKTVAPPTDHKATRSPIKLSNTVVAENHRYRTEPSLSYRSRSFSSISEGEIRAAGLPSRPPYSLFVVIGLLALAAGCLGALFVEYGLGNSPDTVRWDNGIDGQPGYLDVPQGVTQKAPASASPTTEPGVRAPGSERPPSPPTPNRSRAPAAAAATQTDARPAPTVIQMVAPPTDTEQHASGDQNTPASGAAEPSSNAPAPDAAPGSSSSSSSQSSVRSPSASSSSVEEGTRSAPSRQASDPSSSAGQEESDDSELSEDRQLWLR